MINIWKLWLREAVEIGLPAILFLATANVIDIGWRYGILSTLVPALFVALFTLYITIREFSKPTYPLDIVPEKPIIDPGTRTFRPRRLSAFTTIWLGLAGAIVYLFILTSEPFRLVPVILYTAFILYFLIGWAIHYINDRLSIAEEGMVFHMAFYSIAISWNEIDRIERRGTRWFLICRSSQIDAIPSLAKWLRFVEADRVINLSRVTSNFLEGGMAKSMAGFSTAIKVVGMP